MENQHYNLRQLVQKSGQLPFQLAARYLVEVACQLSSYCPAGTVDCDIRPSKIIVCDTGGARLSTLCNRIAKYFRHNHDLDADEANEMVEYLAPEQASHSPQIDERSNIYRLGCVLYFMLAGQPPFATGSISDRLLRHQHAMPEAIASLRPDVPAEFATICETMLAKKQSDRYPSIESVIKLVSIWREPT